MSRNGTGTYNLPAGNPVVTATTITSNWANTTLNDIGTALTGSLAADGQTPATGNLNLNTNRIINVVNPSSAQDAATKSYVDALIDGIKNQPAFSVSLSSGQNISNSTDTVVLYDTEAFDTANAYNTATGRFTPQVAGYYQINVNIQLSGSAITLASSAIRKNGTIANYVGTSAFTFTSTPYRFSGSSLIYCNGSTDYIDTTAFISATSGNNVVANSAFSGVLVRAA